MAEIRFTGPPFQKIIQAAETTGLSQFYLRSGCKDGTVPHVKSGTTYFINIPALLEKLGLGVTGCPTNEA